MLIGFFILDNVIALNYFIYIFFQLKIFVILINSLSFILLFDIVQLRLYNILEYLTFKICKHAIWISWIVKISLHSLLSYFRWINWLWWIIRILINKLSDLLLILYLRFILFWVNTVNHQPSFLLIISIFTKFYCFIYAFFNQICFHHWVKVVVP